MSYRKDQGRYARMLAFWGIVLLVAYGCFRGGGLVTVLDGWLAETNTTFVDPFPLLGTLKTSTVIALGLVGFVALMVHSFTSSRRVADALIETEAEMHKVTWPNWPETWNGTVAVTGMVVVLLVFLTLVDLLLVTMMRALWGGS